MINKVAVLLEDLIAKFHTFGEGLDGLRDEVKEFRGETSNRLSVLEQKAFGLKLELNELRTENKQDQTINAGHKRA